MLNVAVSVAAGVAALTSAFPGLLPWTVPLCIAVLAVVMGVNLRGLVTGARLFAFPAALFVALLVVVITVGMLRGEPNPLPAPTQAEVTSSVGILLILAAFANGCASLTGVEAIANATPSFRAPSAQRAARAELGLGIVLGTLLLGLAALIERFDLQPVEGRTVLSLLTEGSIGTGAGYLLVQLTTVLLLALAANTSYGRLPVLAARLAADNALPHVFGLRADRMVYRQGIIVLSVLAGLLLLATGGQTSILVPLFAIGVFIGFSLCQAGMVLHWLRERGPGWRWRLALNGAGAVLTTVAAIVVTTEKFFAGAWLIVLVVPLLSLVFISVRRAYDRIGTVLEVDREELPRSFPGDAVVVVPVVSITRLAEETLSAALSLSDNVTAVHVVFTDDEQNTADAERAHKFAARFRRWQPNIPLVMLDSPHRGDRQADRALRAHHRGRLRDRADRRGRARPLVGARAVQPAWRGGRPRRRAAHRRRGRSAAFPAASALAAQAGAPAATLDLVTAVSGPRRRGWTAAIRSSAPPDRLVPSGAAAPDGGTGPSGGAGRAPAARYGRRRPRSLHRAGFR